MSIRHLSNLEPVLKPIDEARGLANDHYVSKEVYEEEKQALLFNNWAGLDFAKNVPNGGDAKPLDFMGMPLLIVRDRDGSIGVFQNSCRHRGMILVDKPTKIRGVISCPYHGWCYSTKGELRSTPHVGGLGVAAHQSIKNEELGLWSVRSYVWKDIIFVNISGNAPEFEDYAGPLIEAWKDFEQPMFHGGENSSFTLDIKSNWKLAVENYSESYHLPWIHPALNTYSKIDDHYNIVEDSVFCGQGTMVYQQYQSENEAKFPDFKNLASKWDKSAEYITLFPNVMLGVHRDHFFAIILEPLGVELTREHVELYYAKDAESIPQHHDMTETNSERWKIVFGEDVPVVEGMQRTRHGQLFDGGRFSPVLDNATHCFHRWVAQSLSKTRASKDNHVQA